MALRNRVALITGGTRGIGRGIAMRLAKEGARIAIGYRTNKNIAQNTLRQLQAAGADCVAVEADITSGGRCEQFVNTVTDRFGRLDILINNVGDFRWGTLAEGSLDDWQDIFASNLMSVVFMSRAVLPQMRKGRWGLSSISAQWVPSELSVRKNFGVRVGESRGGGIVAIAGLGRSEKRHHGKCGESFKY